MKSRKHAKTNRRKFRATKSKVYRKSRRNARKIMRGGDTLPYPYNFTSKELAEALHNEMTFRQGAIADKYIKPLIQDGTFNVNDWKTVQPKTAEEEQKMVDTLTSKFSTLIEKINTTTEGEALIKELQSGRKLSMRGPPDEPRKQSQPEWGGVWDGLSR